MSAVRTIRDQITDQIREDLLCGRIPAGTRLSDSELAKRFGVSRGPIRESLVQLTGEGLLIAKPNCGVSVAPEPSDEIREVITPIRRTIETYALKSFFDDINDQDFRVWDEILLRMERACREDNLEEIALEHIAFHRSIITRSGQADLLAIWHTILVRVRGYFRDAVQNFGGSLAPLYVEHCELVDVFRARDKSAALAALDDHIR